MDKTFYNEVNEEIITAKFPAVIIKVQEGWLVFETIQQYEDARACARAIQELINVDELSDLYEGGERLI